MHLHVRYETPDDRKETRRQRNARFGQPSPVVVVPPAGAHVWEWFWALSNRRKSGPEALSFGEIGEWQRVTGTQIRPPEVEMLIQMDNAYLSAVRDEQEALIERRRQETEGKR